MTTTHTLINGPDNRLEYCYENDSPDATTDPLQIGSRIATGFRVAEQHASNGNEAEAKAVMQATCLLTDLIRDMDSLGARYVLEGILEVLRNIYRVTGSDCDITLHHSRSPERCAVRLH